MILSAKPENPKEMVIQSLLNKSPLTAKEIFNECSKQFNYNSSYQAMHKTIKEMESESIIAKENSKYSISIAWVKDKKKIFSELETQIQGKSKSEKEIKVINCKTYHEFGRTLLELFANEVDQNISNDACSFQNHLWWIFTLQKDEYYWFKKLGITKCLMACKGNSLVDKFTATAYRTIGHIVKLNVDYESNCDIVVSDDRVYQIYFPDQTKEMMKKATTEIKNSIDAFIKEYPEQMFQEKGTIKIVILKDRELADQFRKDIKKFFTTQELNKHEKEQINQRGEK